MPETTPSDAPAVDPSGQDEASIEDLVAALGDPAFQPQPTADPGDPATYADLDLADELPVDPDDDLRGVRGSANERLVSIVESLLFASSKPLRVRDIRRLLKDPSKRQIQLAIKALVEATKQGGVVLGQVAGGFRFRTNPENAEYVQRLITGRPARLSRSQLETLAVVAYRQPVTKSEIDHIRGVDCGAVLRLLLERDLAKIVGRKEEPGRPHVYGTTVKFLEFFNLRGLRDMPDLHEFRELSDESAETLREHLGDNTSDGQEDLGQETLAFRAEGEGEGAEEATPEEATPEDDVGAESASDTASDAASETAADAASETASETTADTAPETAAVPSDDSSVPRDVTTDDPEQDSVPVDAVGEHDEESE